MKKIISMLCAGLLLLPGCAVPARAAGQYEAELQQILDSILTKNMTDAEKVEAITKYVGETYVYDAGGQTYADLLENGGGDCWATTDMIVRLSRLAGFRAAYHDSSRDPGPLIYASQHISAQVLADGQYYLADAGFSDESPVQYYLIALGEEPYRPKENEDGTVTAYVYAGFDTEVTVPDTLGGKTVTKIGSWAFQQWQLHGWNGDYLAYLKWEFIKPVTVTLPDTVTEIEKGAFYQNDLSKIYLPASLQTIGEKAFYDCANLTDIYYAGTEEQWKAITVADGNTAFETAVIHYQASGILQKVEGDVNADGVLDVSDVILLQKWLLAVPEIQLADWEAADLCADDQLDVWDLGVMKRELLRKDAK